MLSALAIVLVIASLLGINWISNWFRSERNADKVKLGNNVYRMNDLASPKDVDCIYYNGHVYEYVGDKPSYACRKIMEHEEQR